MPRKRSKKRGKKRAPKPPPSDEDQVQALVLFNTDFQGRIASEVIEMVYIENGYDVEKTRQSLEELSCDMGQAEGKGGGSLQQSAAPESTRKVDIHGDMPETRDGIGGNSQSVAKSRTLEIIDSLSKMFEEVDASVIRLVYFNSKQDINACISALLTILGDSGGFIDSQDDNSSELKHSAAISKKSHSEPNRERSLRPTRKNASIPLDAWQRTHTVWGRGTGISSSAKRNVLNIAEELDREKAQELWKEELRNLESGNTGKTGRRGANWKGKKVTPQLLGGGCDPLTMKTFNRWKGTSGKDWLTTPHLSSFLKLDAVKKLYPSVNDDTIEETFRNAGFDFYVTLLWLQNQYPNEDAAKKIRSLEDERRAGSLFAMDMKERKESSETSHSQAQGGLSSHLRKFLLENLDPSGSSFGGSNRQKYYEEARESVLGLRRRREKICRRAASGSNNPAAIAGAMTLAVEQMKKIRKEIKTAELEVLKSMYLFSNKEIDNSKKVDLHGLHVAESRRILAELMKIVRNRGRKEYRVVTGVGLHSSGSSKLGPAMEQFVKSIGHHCYWENPGVLKITLRESQADSHNTG
eukprot:CAMPEP_0114505080 /NCGR_PEP_ID=MMETSP0109-20121206/10652_1 /TAXON_ID=29199 /ORGANISM="Chlorarachnion reptans, Strain CCCM449" /LENGTH=579 /DNA_ID=CAMNT_0001683475 /DNA_START=473 /DNA_END=2212 /DNA_ORIENTATION=-